MTAYNKKGFTLIELLIVMAILGVLAVVVLVAINPVQQLARTRDSGRKSGITQLGHSLEAYYTARGGTYVTESTTWIDDLVTAGEIASVPSAIGYRAGFTAAGCGSGSEQGTTDWCYDDTGGTGGAPATIFTELESDSEISKCTSGSIAWFVWSTADGRGGLVCSNSSPTPGSQSWNAVQ